MLTSGLAAEGFVVNKAESREAAIKQLEQSTVDLITLDIGLGQDDGLQLAREIRTMINVPILIITGRAEPIDRVRGLEHGADDYVTKPFHIREVILRVRTLLDRYDDTRENQRSVPDAYTFDHAILDLRRRALRRLNGEVIDLTETEIKLLELFLRHPSRVLSRDEINTYLRGRDWSPLDRSLDGHVARLRRKLEPLSDEPHLIKSVRGVGYVFCG
ncbi:DNA-binding response OmpR family regulator [Bradyrhizobium sp. USDA 4452]